MNAIVLCIANTFPLVITIVIYIGIVNVIAILRHQSQSILPF